MSTVEREFMAGESGYRKETEKLIRSDSNTDHANGAGYPYQTGEDSVSLSGYRHRGQHPGNTRARPSHALQTMNLRMIL